MEKTKIGVLIIITGASGAGKDAVMDNFLKSPDIRRLNLQKVVTCTDRPPRPGEVDGVNYHFLTPAKLKELDANGELVEPITQTGTSNKATPKSEIERLLNAENLVWRIDPSRAAEIASGNFFDHLFPEYAAEMQKHTLVLFITAPKSVIDDRRKSRDGKNYKPSEYAARDEQEKPYLEVLQKFATPIQNLDGRLNEAVSESVESVVDFYNRIATSVTSI